MRSLLILLVILALGIFSNLLAEDAENEMENHDTEEMENEGAVMEGEGEVGESEDTPTVDAVVVEPEKTSKEKLMAMAAFIDKKGRGLKAILDNDMKTAEKNFEEAGEIAVKNENIEATLDAGYSLSTIGNTESARKLFDTAKAIAQEAKDWREMLAVGYAYASLPEDENSATDAVAVVQEAEKTAESEKSWRALIEIADAFTHLKSVDLAKNTYDKAVNFLKEDLANAEKEQNWLALIEISKAFTHLKSFELAKSTTLKATEILKQQEKGAEKSGDWLSLLQIGQGYVQLKSAELAKATYDKALGLLEKVKDTDGLEILAKGYEEIGAKDKAVEVAALLNETKKQETTATTKKIRRKKERKEPPAGWSPIGKSLAEAPEISNTSRQILADKAQTKMALANEKALMEIESEKEQTYKFKHFYFGNRFPYRRWDIGNDKFDVNGWAAEQMKMYKMQGGMYVIGD